MMTSTMSRPRREQIGEMIPLLLRHEIQVLLRAGHTQVDTAKRAGVSLRTVRRVIAEDAVTHADDGAARRARSTRYGNSPAGVTLTALASPIHAPARASRPRSSARQARATRVANRIDHCPLSRL